MLTGEKLVPAEIKTFTIDHIGAATPAFCVLSATASIGELSLSVSGGDPSNKITNDERTVLQPSSPVHNVQNTALSLSRTYILGSTVGCSTAVAVNFVNTGSKASDCNIDVGGGADKIASLLSETFALAPGASKSYQFLFIVQ